MRWSARTHADDDDNADIWYDGPILTLPIGYAQLLTRESKAALKRAPQSTRYPQIQPSAPPSSVVAWTTEV